MKTFALPAAARLKLTKTTPRKEHHGEDLVQAISLRLRWETINDDLATLHPNLKAMLFYRAAPVEAQTELAGVPQIEPNLRVPGVALPLKLDAEFTGYKLSIEHGIDDSSALELYVCTLAKFTADANEGGSVAIEWSVSSNKEITPELVGVLCGLEGSEIVATLTPPAIAEGDVIDGSTEAFEREYPPAGGHGDLLDEEAGEMDPTDTFSSQHGAHQSDDDDESDSRHQEDRQADFEPAQNEPEVKPETKRRGRRVAA